MDGTLITIIVAITAAILSVILGILKNVISSYLKRKKETKKAYEEIIMSIGSIYLSKNKIISDLSELKTEPIRYYNLVIDPKLSDVKPGVKNKIIGVAGEKGQANSEHSIFPKITLDKELIKGISRKQDKNISLTYDVNPKLKNYTIEEVVA